MLEITLLQRARKLIENRQEEFICFAIIALRKGARGEEASERLRDYIMLQLGGHTSLCGWLYTHHNETFMHMTLGDIREARLQWIDWMIEQYKEKNKRSKSAGSI